MVKVSDDSVTEEERTEYEESERKTTPRGRQRDKVSVTGLTYDLPSHCVAVRGVELTEI